MSRSPHLDRRQASHADYLASWHATNQLLREGRSFSGHERNCAFLNSGGGKFANISAVSGFDFDDDGRALAVVDWDHDGDLDVWLHNRTGPRLRFLRNGTVNANTTTRAKSVAIRLRGVTSNRDAIGARVEIVRANPDSRPLMQTIYAGDAFLSQSSKELIFGLGTDGPIDKVRVRWPGGSVEEFTGVQPSGRFLLREGTGQAEAVANVARPTPPADQEVASHDTADRVRLAARIPLPLLTWHPQASVTSAPLRLNNRPTLLCFWASWCAPCVSELQQLTRDAERLSSAGLDVYLLSVDGLDPTQPGEPADALALLKKMAAPFPAGIATRETLDKLALLDQIVLSRQAPFTVPLSLLIDDEGQLSVIYRGALTVEELLTDLPQLTGSAAERRDRAVPFAGRWLSPPKTMLLRPVANVFRQHGYLDDDQRYRELELELLTRRRQQANSPEAAAAVDRQYATACDELGRLAQAHEQLDEAATYYRVALVSQPQATEIRWRLAHVLRQQGDTAAAIEQLQQVVTISRQHLAAQLELSRAYGELPNPTLALQSAQAAFDIDPTRADVCFQLGVARLAAEQRDGARDAFERALQADPDHVDSLINLAAMLAARGDLPEATTHLERAVRLAPERLEARLNLGGAYGSAGQFQAAADQFASVVASHPESAAAHARLAQARMALGQIRTAIPHFEQALQLNPRDLASQHRLAWIRATATDDDLRNGPQALELAEKLATTSRRRDPRLLDTLAAACATVGDYARAVQVAEQALQQVPENHPLHPAITARLKLYRQRQPYRE